MSVRDRRGKKKESEIRERKRIDERKGGEKEMERREGES